MDEQMENITQAYTPIYDVPIAYACFAAYYSFLTILWTSNCIRHSKQGIALQRTLLYVIIAKALDSGALFAYTLVCVQRGECLSPLKALLYITSTLFEVLLFLGMILIAKGWYITRTSLETQEKKTLICNLLCLMICETARQLNPFFAFPLYVMFVVMFGHIFSSILINIRSLTIQQMEFSNAYPDVPGEQFPSYQKIVLFRKLRVLLCSYIIFTVTSLVVVLLFAADNNKYRSGVAFVLTELVPIIIIPSIGYLVRCRDFSTYHRFDTLPQNTLNQHQITIEFDMDDPGFITSQVNYIEQQAPQAPEEAQAEQMKLDLAYEEDKVIVIRNPSDEKKSTSNYAVALRSLEPPLVNV
ncbi:hypothetical protein AKO1_014408 [Acrasis kona]|uniref:GOST seven transmembrane domain-containing protein n=1 Tax=Acrasis kona TaxID=1008807 RepID=A0AAW2YZR5_9EUKA